MSPKPFGLLLAALLTSVPVSVFGQSSPRPGPEVNAAELLASSTLDLPDPAETAELDKTFSRPFPINDGIQRNYVLATDELYQPTTDGVGQILKVPSTDKPSQLVRVADILANELRLQTQLVLYPQGDRNKKAARIASSEVLLQAPNENAARNAAAEAGLSFKSAPSYAPGFFVLSADTPSGALSGMRALRSAGFDHANILLTRTVRGQFLPNDPLFPDQWHIRGRGQNGAKKASDARITPVWEQRDSSGRFIRGAGVTIGVVDSGVEWTHPDLTNNYAANLSYDFASNDSDPSPGSAGSSDDAHGTEVGGVAAAEGFNGKGVTGVAPEAKIAGVRIGLSRLSDVSVPFTDEIEASALKWGDGSIRVSNNSWGVGGTILAPNGTLTEQALANSAQSGKIFIFSAGNGLRDQHNTNYEGTKNSIYTLPVAALNDQAIQADYSSPGASVVISAPSGRETDLSSSSRRPQGTSTTDLTGTSGSNTGVPESTLITPIPNYDDLDYTNIFNGTSSAAPVVSGVTALVLQANPSLNWRDVKEIYIRSATRNDSGDSDWARNGAGFWFNHKYGAGLINASEAVRLAKNWSNLGSMSKVEVSLSPLTANIRDNNASGLVKYFDTRSSALAGLRVEHATVTTDITHPSRGELEIQLTSPSGTTSRLAEKHTSYAADPADYPNWTFSTVHNWGEDSRGLWKLKIADRVPGNTGTLNSATLTLYGTAK